ncbi:MAG: 1-deoxy-D-xylulose-5-phosphate reductoisomerase [Burkholderiales bacterium]|nr:1-deoxy-D-xylulose-5-phosphate reductoisomerase [Burkholderiales bacterium]
MNVQTITVLGATGSIGMSTLDVIARHPQRFRVHALSANRQWERLFDQCKQFQPRYAVLLDEAAAEQLREKLKHNSIDTEVLQGLAALEHVASESGVDTVMAAIVGAAGLKPALAAACAGKRVLLANKEALVMSGQIFMQAVHDHGATLLPIDSEHNAIFQSLPRNGPHNGNGDLRAMGVRRILLTASGGPFRTIPIDALARVTPEQACAHPNWVMGRKISVDSATMMNKGLEVIEAHWLFNAPVDQIQVVIHPQSVIHSMVEYIDGSVIAQLGNPDMRTPIAYALGFPERIESGVSALDLFQVARLDFEAPDARRFPCIALAYAALRAGGTAPAVLNAANEIAVAAFLDAQLPFQAIASVIEHTLAAIPLGAVETLAQVLAADALARHIAHEQVARSQAIC